MYPGESPHVVLRDVAHRWGEGPPLFSGINLSLRRGETVALTGPSGSGKSTLLSIVAGWLAPSGGHVERRGVRRAHWVFQNPHGLPRRTAIDHVAYPFIARGLSRRDAEDRAFTLITSFGLAPSAHRLFAELSGGEAQRLLLARAVAVEPDLLLVDEPTAQLDREAARGVNAVLSTLAQAGAIVLVASHDADTVDACQRSLQIGAVR